MPRLILSVLLLTVVATGRREAMAAPPDVNAAETKYLSFQLMTGIHNYAGPQPAPGHFALGQAQLEAFVHDVVRSIGTTGDVRHKLGYTVGPLCFDMSDDETRQFVRDAFAVAREHDIAVAFHIDDSMAWGERKDLLANPDNIETAGWTEKPNSGRRADWGPSPTRFPPQMCFNSPAIVAAVKDRAGLIGAEIRRELAALKSQGKEHLFAGVIAGWETQIGSDFETDHSLGYRALVHRGFSATNPPRDPDRERARIVQEFMELWARSLCAGGVPRDRVFCHIAFTDQGLRAADAKQSHAEKVHFALPEVAFSPAYRPGFSTYPEGATFLEIHAVLAKHGAPGWISAEGTNVSPTSMPGEPNMETYLGKMFNHGAVMVNIFAWGIGGDAMRDNFFRRATEGPEALAAYAKFLRHEALVESAASGFSGAAFQAKIRRVQAELPGWVQKSGRQAEVMPLTRQLDSFIQGRKWREADRVVDQLLALMKSPPVAKPQEPPLQERLPAKVRRIQKELPAWVEKTGNRDRAAALMDALDRHLKAKELEDAEATADSILKMLGANAEPPAAPAEAMGKRISGKVERVKEGVKRWQAEGRDPSPIIKTMQEKVGPLLDAGKPLEAEPELDRVLEQLGKPPGEAHEADALPRPGPAGSVWYTVGNLSVDLLTRAWGSPIVELMRKSSRLQALIPKAQIAGPERVELESLGGRLSQLMNRQQFAEASRTLDRMLAIVGQRGDLPAADPRADLARERADLIRRAHATRADGVEDYIGWAVVETRPDHWDWSLYQENAREIHRAGLKYVPYVWVQNLPTWVRHGADQSFATCLEHGKASEALSVFSPRTVAAYDRVFARLAAALGTQIDALRIGTPYDYGETHYPAGDANGAFPDAHIHPGWWAGEPEARRHFRRWVETKYGSVDRLNAAWGLHISAFEFDYPRDPTSPRRWLDFVEWYHEAFIERLGVLFDVARKHFPETPICVNLGWPVEKLVLGQDLSGLVKMLAAKGIIVRTPTGPMVTHLYTRRVATAARFYHAPKLSTEPADGSAPLAEVAGALFKDLTTGVQWHFDYPPNMERAAASFQNARALPRHDYPRIDAAIFFPTTAHRLENWELHDGLRGGYPEGMAPWLESLRDVLDYDVVDERLIGDGALRLYRLLIWPSGTRVESRTMDRVRDWVENGGTLLVRDLKAVRTVEGNPITTPTGKGRVVDAGGSLDRLAGLVRNRDPQMTGLPPLDARPDGVLTSLFDDGILLFNRTASAVTVELSMPAGRWDVAYPGLPGSVTLPPLAIRWLGREGIPEQVRRALRRVLHGSFLVFYASVQDDLKLTTEQKKKLEKHLQEVFPDATQFIHELERLGPQEREKVLETYRRKVQEQLTAVLKQTLEEGQRKRLRQLELQHEMPFSMETWNVLKVTDEQRKQFTPVVQDLQTKIEALVQSGGAIEEIWPRIQQLRKEHGDRIVALLSDAQKKQWKEMIGKPLDLGE